MLSPANLTAGETGNGKHRTDHYRDDPKDPDDVHGSDKTDDEQNNTQNDHDTSPLTSAQAPRHGSESQLAVYPGCR